MNTRKFRAAFLTLTVAALVAVPAASAQTASEERSETPAAVSERTTVVVVDANRHDITVYAVRSGYRRRLGTVTSFTSRVFTLPRTFLIPSGELRLIADPIGRRGSSLGLTQRRPSAAPRASYVSEPLLVNAGDVVEWRLENSLGLSSIFVYRFRGEDL